MFFNKVKESVSFIKKLIGSIVRRITHIGKGQLSFILIFAVMFSGLLSTYNYLVYTHRSSMIVTLNYEGAKSGLTPEGGRFDINEIKSDEVLQRVVDSVGDKNLTVDYLRTRIDIDTRTSKSSLEQTLSAIKSGATYSYAPAEFAVSYSQKDKFGKNYLMDVIQALADSFDEYFKENYSNKNYILEYSAEEDYSKYDYDEICRVLNDTISSMIIYLTDQRAENITFVSETTGYSYTDIINKLANIRDVSVDKLNAYVMMNRVSKNKELLLNKHSYLIDTEMRKYNYVNDSSNIVNDTLSVYDGGMTGVVFVPSVDDAKEYYMGRTKTGLDNLVDKAYADGSEAVGIKKTIDSYEDTYERFSEAPESTQEQNMEAENMIKNIRAQIKEVSDLAIATDNEFQNIITNKYLAFKMPEEYGLPIVYAIKMLMAGLVLGFVICRVFMSVVRRVKKLFL